MEAPNLISCPYALDPTACFAEKQRLHGDSEERRSRRIRCDYCPVAYSNAVIAHPPEDNPDFDTFNFRDLKIDPADFLDTPPKTEPKKKEKCAKGHPLAVHGLFRKGHGWRCRMCESIQKRKRYAAKKAAA